MLCFLEMIAEMVDDFRFGTRFGFSGILWKLATYVCLIVTVCGFVWEWYIIGIIGIAGTVVSLIFSFKCTFKNIKETREAEGNHGETDSSTC